MPQRLSTNFPQTKSSGSRQSKPAAKRQKVQSDVVPSISTPSKTSTLRSSQLHEEEDEECLRQFDLTSKFGKLPHHVEPDGMRKISANAWSCCMQNVLAEHGNSFLLNQAAQTHPPPPPNNSICIIIQDDPASFVPAHKSHITVKCKASMTRPYLS